MNRAETGVEISELNQQCFLNYEQITDLHTTEEYQDNTLNYIADSLRGLRYNLARTELHDYEGRRAHLVTRGYAPGFMALYAIHHSVKGKITGHNLHPDHRDWSSLLADRLGCCNWQTLKPLIDSEIESIITDDETAIQDLYEAFLSAATDVTGIVSNNYLQRIAENSPYEDHRVDLRPSEIPKEQLKCLLGKLVTSTFQEERDAILRFNPNKALLMLEHIFNVATAKSLLDHVETKQLDLKEEALEKARTVATPKDTRLAVKYLQTFESLIKADEDNDEAYVRELMLV